MAATNNIEGENIPALRFPEFKGEWEERKFGALGSFKGGGTPDTSVADYWSGSIPWISSSDIIEKDISNIKVSRNITHDAIKNSATKLIPEGSLLIVSRVGVGKFAIASEDLCTSQDFCNFTPAGVESKYIGYWLSQNTNKLHSCSQGTSIKGFTTGDLKSIMVPVPTKYEQQKIAAFLTAVDEKIGGLSKKKDLLEQYKKSVMQKLFSQQIRFTDDHDNPYPDWEEKKLGDILTIGSGRDYKHLGSGEVPVYGSGGFMTSVNEWLYEGESVCIGRKGTIDKPMFMTGRFWTVDTLFYTHSFQSVLPKFVLSIFQQINWKKHNEASGVPSLSKTTIQAIKVDIPHPDEQQKIADFLSSLDQKIDHTINQLDQAKSFKKGLLQQMFV